MQGWKMERGGRKGGVGWNTLKASSERNKKYGGVKKETRERERESRSVTRSNRSDIE